MAKMKGLGSTVGDNGLEKGRNVKDYIWWKCHGQVQMIIINTQRPYIDGNPAQFSFFSIVIFYIECTLGFKLCWKKNALKLSEMQPIWERLQNLIMSRVER